MLMHAARSVLVVVDIQERLCPVMDDPRRVLFNAARLLKGASLMDVPVLCTEQYPKGLGPTMIDVRELLPEGAVIEKTSFGSMGERAFREALARTGRDQVVLLGTEAHVCVLQTALGLREAGIDVFMVADACGSRRPESERAGLERARDAGCAIVTTEMVLFEWVADKTDPRFREISALVK